MIKIFGLRIMTHRELADIQEELAFFRRFVAEAIDKVERQERELETIYGLIQVSSRRPSPAQVAERLINELEGE